MNLKKRQLENLCSSPIFWWSRLFGLLLFNDLGRFDKKFAYRSILINGILVGLSLVVAFSHSPQKLTTTQTAPTLTVVFTEMNVVMINLSSIILVWTMIRRPLFCQMVFGHFWLKRDQFRHKKILLVLISFSLLNMTLVIFKGVVNSRQSFVIGCIRVSMITINTLGILQFTEILRCISGAFNSLKRTKFNINEHVRLRNLAVKVNQLYGQFLLLTVFTIFVHLLANSYWVVTIVVLGNNDWVVMASGVYYSVSFSVPFGRFLLLAQAIKSVTKAADEALDDLLYNVAISPVEVHNPEVHLYLSSKPSLVFTACGFFQLGYPLLTSMMGGIITYLMIVIQFSEEQKGFY